MKEQDKKRISEELSVLVGQSLWTSYRQTDVELFQFGPKYASGLLQGSIINLGTYSLLIACAWRFVGARGIFVASEDRFFPASHLDEEELEEFVWTERGSNRRDELLLELFSNPPESFKSVTSVEIDSIGGFQLNFGPRLKLEVFPNISSPHAYWSLISPPQDHKILCSVSSLGVEK